MKFGWEDIIVWPSAAGNRAERGGGAAAARRAETDGAAQEPSEMNAATRRAINWRMLQVTAQQKGGNI